MYIGVHLKCPLFLSDFKETRIFQIGFSNNPQISNFVEIRPVGAELFRATQTGRHDEANSRIACPRRGLALRRTGWLWLRLPICRVMIHCLSVQRPLTSPRLQNLRIVNWRNICYSQVVGARGWGTALQAGRSRVWFPMVSLEFFIDMILPIALWPRGRLSL